MSTPTLHRLDLAEPGTFTGARIVCLAPETAICRQWCTEPSCEEGCRGTPVLAPDVVELIAQAPTDQHQWAPYDGCREADWITNCGVEDLHADADGETFPWNDDGETRRGIRSGYVAITWDDDDYWWTYAEDAPDVDQPVHPDQLTLQEA